MASSQYKLYCMGESGNAYKVALMLALCEANWEAIWVDFFNGETRQKAFHEINPMGEVPVLLHNDEVLSQSGVILDYLVNQFEQFGWHDEQQRRDILRWLLFDNHKFTNNIATLRFMTTFLKTGETEVTQFLHGRASAALAVVENHLAERQFMVDERPTIADFSICGYLYYADEIPIDFAKYPNVQGLTKRVAELPNWQHPYDLMPRQAAS